MSASRDILPTLGPHVPLREATAYGVGPKYLIRDNDGKFGMGFARPFRFWVGSIMTIEEVHKLFLTT